MYPSYNFEMLWLISLKKQYVQVNKKCEKVQAVSILLESYSMYSRCVWSVCHHTCWLKRSPRGSEQPGRAGLGPGSGAGVTQLPRGYGWARIRRRSVTDGQRDIPKWLDRCSWRWLDCRKGWGWSRVPGRCMGPGCIWAGRFRGSGQEIGCDCRLDWNPPLGAAGGADASLESWQRPLQQQKLWIKPTTTTSSAEELIIPYLFQWTAKYSRSLAVALLLLKPTGQCQERSSRLMGVLREIHTREGPV